MNKFFSEINQYLNIKDWVDILDWIFNEKNIFLGWSRNHVGKFTKKIKRLDGINQRNFMCLAENIISLWFLTAIDMNFKTMCMNNIHLKMRVRAHLFLPVFGHLFFEKPLYLLRFIV